MYVCFNPFDLTSVPTVLMNNYSILETKLAKSHIRYTNIHDGNTDLSKIKL